MPTQDTDDTLFGANPDKPLAGWRSRRNDPGHTVTDSGHCADPRCAEFRTVYPQAFTLARNAAIANGNAEFTADQVRVMAQRMVPDVQPCHVNSIGAYWVRWRRDGLIRVIGAGRSVASSGKGTLNYAYRPVMPETMGLHGAIA